MPVRIFFKNTYEKLLNTFSLKKYIKRQQYFFLLILTALFVGIICFNYILSEKNFQRLIEIFSLIISFMSFIFVALLYDRFGVKGFVKQRELEKIKELKSTLIKTRYFCLTRNTHKISNDSTCFKDLNFNDRIILEKDILDNFYLKLNTIVNDPFFPEKLYLDFNYFHFSKHSVYIENSDDYFLLSSSNIYPEIKDFRILNNEFSNKYFQSLEIIDDFIKMNYY